ncbi:hypothetical protein COU57_03795 [Candidatus Pacearchaeota archaeon CG10_big_fil_rev_8_21_14_0_10_32_14]|nr:MAG: hypothetical protein COU57_03795 [Candidatus Pacearchaeota archaeon CG10_big_fil_rev_8_21_14_0_10_32_14]
MGIFDILLPREDKFFDYMIKQANILYDTSRLFSEFIHNLSKISEEESRQFAVRIKELEIKGDEIEHFIINQLDKTFITPLDREDIHSIVINIDKAIDIINSTSQKLYIYRIKKTPDNILEFSNIIVDASIEVKKLIFNLKSKKELKSVLRKIHEIENKADNLFYNSTASLFRSKTNTINIIKFKEIYGQLEEVVDSMDYIGKIVRGILVKQG